MPSLDFNLLASGACFTAFVYAYLVKYRGRGLSSLSLPPGPPGKPIVGNLFDDLPTKFEWHTYHEWAKKYNSDIISMNLAGTTFIILDSAEAAYDLLECRSSIYADRMRFPMVNELMGWDFNFGFMKHGEDWRQRRRIMHQSFHPTAVSRFKPHAQKATHELLRRLLNEPKDFFRHIRHMGGEVIMSVTYGIDVQPKDDPYIGYADRAVHYLVAAAVPGAFLVDTLPFLKYVPDWMPGAGFKLKAKEWGKAARCMVEEPFNHVKRGIADGTARDCLALDGLRRIDESGDVEKQEIAVQSTAGTMYAAGSDTTAAAIKNAILGLMCNQEALKKAQAEIDSVVEPGELPEYEDEDKLPYITAVVKETLRWRDVVPIAIPHVTSVEDIYKGYRIPAGAVVIPNSWAMLHDERYYPDPFTFNPDRFMKDGKLNPDVKNPDHATWGYGRRVCPGRHLAFASVWMAVASIITVFDLSKPLDENGNPIEPTHEYVSSLVVEPKPFKCDFKPRSEAAIKAIRDTVNRDYHMH